MYVRMRGVGAFGDFLDSFLVSLKEGIATSVNGAGFADSQGREGVV